jgi:hypothetical protein
MYISTATKYFNRFSQKETLAFLKECGFNAYDFTIYAGETPFGITDYGEKAKALREYGESIGIVCHQTHAPYPTAKIDDETYNRDMFFQIVRTIEISGVLGRRYAWCIRLSTILLKRISVFIRRLNRMQGKRM